MIDALYAIVGAGGFGKEVMPVLFDLALRESGNRELVFVDDALAGRQLCGAPVLSEQQLVDHVRREGRASYFNVAIGDSVVREAVASRLLDAGLLPLPIISPLANVQRGVKIAAGAVICPFATVNASADIGRFVHLNIYSYCAHDTKIGDFVTLAPQAAVNGHCTVGRHAYIGTGAILLPGVTIGMHAVIGAGAVVRHDIQEGAVFVGNPARFLRYQPGFYPGEHSA